MLTRWSKLNIKKLERFKFLLKSLFLLAVIAVTYHNVYHFDFLNAWDDQWFVTNRFTEGGLNFGNLYEIFSTFYMGQYAPLNQIYYTFLYNLFGYNASAFHLSNLTIHFFNALLVEKLSTVFGQEIFPAITAEKFGFVTACFFAISPVNVEAVAWLSASKVLIYTFFYLISILFYVKFIASKNAALYFIVVLAFLLSFFAKEQAVTLPVALLLIDWYLGRNLKSKNVWLEKAPLFILSLLFGMITIESQFLWNTTHNFYPLQQRMPLAMFTVIEYAAKCIIPINLSYLYPFPFLNGESVPWWMWCYVILVPILVWQTFMLKNRLISLCLIFFLTHIILVSNLTSLARHSLIADRYTYVSSIGICMLIAYILQRIPTNLRKTGSLIGIVYFVSLASYSLHHVNVWKNDYTLKRRLKQTIESRPDFDKLKKKTTPIHPFF